MKHVKGPDFPGGGTSWARRASATPTPRAAARSGARQGSRRADEGRQGGDHRHRAALQVKKGGEGGLITKIADLVRDKKITGISDLRDESDRNGMRLVIELKRGGDPAQVVLNQLYKRTAMQQAFGINMVALVDGVPKTLSLLERSSSTSSTSSEVITRRTQHQLARAEARAHILEGLLIALDNLDAVIKLIRGSKDPDTARDGLIEQVQPHPRRRPRRSWTCACSASPRSRPTRSSEEHTELTKLIKELRAILADEKRVLGLVKSELTEIAERYGDDRRTEITAAEGDLDIEDVIADQQMVVSITASGYAKRTPLTTYRQQRRGGRGVMGMNMKEGDYIEHLHVCSTHDYLLFFTNQGKVYRLKVYELPEGSRASRGRALVNVLPLKDKERVMTVIPTRDFSEGKYLVFGTKQGMVKKTPFKDYDTPIRADGIIAINVRKGDELVRVRMTSGKDDIIMVSKSGHAIRFNEKQARPMGRGTAGVKGMNVSDKGNEVLSLDVVDSRTTKGELLVVTENGYGKRTSLTEYPVKGRGGKGVLTAKLTAKKGGLAGARVVREGQELIFISQTGMVQRNAVDGISRMGRPTQGVRLMNLKKGDLVSAVALVVESDRTATATARPQSGTTVEDEAPTQATVADEAAAAEAAGNGEAKVTKAKAAAQARKAAAKPRPSRHRRSRAQAALKPRRPSRRGPGSSRSTRPRRSSGPRPKSASARRLAKVEADSTPPRRKQRAELRARHTKGFALRSEVERPGRR